MPDTYRTRLPREPSNRRQDQARHGEHDDVREAPVTYRAALRWRPIGRKRHGVKSSGWDGLGSTRTGRVDQSGTSVPLHIAGRSIVLAAALTLMTLGCSGVYAGLDRDNLLGTPLPPLPDGPHVSVLVLGDFGTGERGQRELADTMTRVHADSPPDLVITLGDNFYPHGVETTDDPLWEEVFEGVYTGSFWNDVPFYPTLGNHDRRRNPQAQVDYSALSRRWRMPAFYYVVEEELPGSDPIFLFALDTDPIDDEEPEADAQLEWLEAQLARPASWKIAFGHHPFISSSFHGGSSDMIDLALPVFGDDIDLYLAGHDHITEMLLFEGLPQAVCGGGAGEDNAYGLQPGSGSLFGFTGGGWCYMRIYDDVIALDLLDVSGEVRYRHFVRKDQRASNPTR